MTGATRSPPIHPRRQTSIRDLLFATDHGLLTTDY
jgi:hypothetical protein